MRKSALVLTATLLFAVASRADQVKCCFANPGYSGICEVTPGKGETCQGVLNYLNNPQSSGKSYCGGTSIRGGWQSVACKTAS
jgi:hypothetical protein